jgi:uncharacterized protein
MAERLEIILKLTERCNIACTYCYYFENEDQSAFGRPARLTDEAAQAFVERVHEALESGHYRHIRIIFHGGEPMMYGKARFRELCEKLTLQHASRLELCMQTNATLIDEEWIRLFEEFNVRVGVSVDGPAHIHDRHRIDKKGKPTHHSVVKGVRMLVDAANAGRMLMPGVLIVMQEGTDPAEILSFLTAELELTQMDFLLPDATLESRMDTSWVGHYLVGLFRAWLECDQEKVNVRFIKSTLSMLMGGRSYLGGYGPEQSNALTVLSNGDINGDDFLRPCGDNFLELNASVFDASLVQAEVLNRFRLASVNAQSLPDECTSCAFQNTCHGGQLTHRFSLERLFNNPTIYCGELKRFYQEVCTKLVQSGVPATQIAEVLAK